MLKSISCFLAIFFFVVHAYNEQGEGVWSLIDIDQCEKELENVIVTFDVERHRANRTHEYFHIETKTTTAIDDSFGVFIDLCKFVDGGCKHYNNIVDGLKKLLHSVAKNNTEKAFMLAGIDPPDFPIPEGHHIIDNFMMDYCELPRYCHYGKFEAHTYIVKDKEYVSCMKFVVEFKKPEEETC